MKKLSGFVKFKKNCPYPHGKGKVSIAYLEACCEFIYKHHELIRKDKLKRILTIEKIIKVLLKKYLDMGMKVEYIPTYSTKLKQEIKKLKPCNHKKITLGYIQWHEWADRKIRMGHVQRKCPNCGLWFFKCEM